MPTPTTRAAADDPEGDDLPERMRQLRTRLVEPLLETARLLAKVETAQQHRGEGFASVVRYAEHALGLRPVAARELLATGMMMREFPELEPALREGRISFRAVEALKCVLAIPGKGFAKWFAEACSRSARDFCALVREQLRTRRHPIEPTCVSMWMTPRGAASLRRAIGLACARQPQRLTRGEAVARVADDYLRRHAPVRGRSRHGAADRARVLRSRYRLAAPRRGDAAAHGAERPGRGADPVPRPANPTVEGSPLADSTDARMLPPNASAPLAQGIDPSSATKACDADTESGSEGGGRTGTLPPNGLDRATSQPVDDGEEPDGARQR